MSTRTKNQVRISAAAALLAVSMSAHAVPVTYDIHFGPNGLAAGGGEGTLVWDSDTSTLSNINWDFSPSAIGSGGIIDDATIWNSTGIFGGTYGQLTAEILTGTDASPVACGSTGACLMSFNSAQIFGGPGSVTFSVGTSGVREYSITLTEGTYSGSFASVARQDTTPPRTSVPEPSTLGLLGAGLLGLVIARRRQLLALNWHPASGR